ncbi:MAG: 16S rRNA (cytosine(1402)-N(4))-methyltransferase RsmH [Verrucomicrobia bacterium]|nr:16S rRNA (cytosine(1402)-N(4))-methyltransferase RsmH [Verrucomicrobiota bacterium]
MVSEVIQALQPRDGGRYLDGTVGGGGHAEAILEASSPSGFLVGSDRDSAAVEASTERLRNRGYGGRFEIRRGTFETLGDWVEEGSCDGALLDLGVSSPQLDGADRGFSWQADGPLDMRMDRRQSLTAAAIVNDWPARDLADAFYRLADERHSRRLAAAIVERRGSRPFETTQDLATLAESVLPGGGKTHPATRLFMALRMLVNDELGALERGLPVVFARLKPMSRLAILTFHSVEDRKVKWWGRGLTRDYAVAGDCDVPALRQPKPVEARWVTRKALAPSEDEVRSNPRARSAQLRVLERL